MGLRGLRVKAEPLDRHQVYAGQQGAKLVENADDIVEELNLGICQKESKGPASASQDPVLRSMAAGEPYDLDELAALSGIDRVRLLPRLLELELGCALRRVHGGRFVRFRGPC